MKKKIELLSKDMQKRWNDMQDESSVVLVLEISGNGEVTGGQYAFLSEAIADLITDLDNRRIILRDEYQGYFQSDRDRATYRNLESAVYRLRRQVQSLPFGLFLHNTSTEIRVIEVEDIYDDMFSGLES